jgi:ankyrin repeat protein
MTDEAGTTALMWAAKFNDIKIMTCLIEAGAGKTIWKYF